MREKFNLIYRLSSLSRISVKRYQQIVRKILIKVFELIAVCQCLEYRVRDIQKTCNRNRYDGKYPGAHYEPVNPMFPPVRYIPVTCLVLAPRYFRQLIEVLNFLTFFKSSTEPYPFRYIFHFLHTFLSFWSGGISIQYTVLSISPQSSKNSMFFIAS